MLLSHWLDSLRWNWSSVNFFAQDRPKSFQSSTALVLPSLLALSYIQKSVFFTARMSWSHADTPHCWANLIHCRAPHQCCQWLNLTSGIHCVAQAPSQMRRLKSAQLCPLGWLTASFLLAAAGCSYLFLAPSLWDFRSRSGSLNQFLPVNQSLLKMHLSWKNSFGCSRYFDVSS
jgi:hypothetical protein